MTVIGLTGGSGTGKTTALGVLAERGAAVIDCDAVYHELAAAHGPMLDEIASRFPGVVEGGQLKRKALGQTVFHDPVALADLNDITHKYVGQVVDERLAAFAEGGAELVAIEAIALIESGLAARCDLVFGILAPVEERVRRITAREGIDPAYAKARIESQKPDAFYEAHCHYILENTDETPTAFLAQCRELFGILL